MSADDQAFLDALSSVPNNIRQYSNELADYVDQHLDKVSNILRDQVVPFLPSSMRPKPPPPSKSILHTAASPASMYTRVYCWASRNKILTTVLVILAGGVTYHIIKKNTSRRKKRRAKRASTGARLEVVVIAGSPSEPITRSISLDLERRGFIVYIVCNTIEEEMLVQNEGRQDIKPLMIDITEPSSARDSIDRFTKYLNTPHSPLAGTRPHYLIFRSLLLIPTQTYPSQPIATLAPSTLSDLLNTRLLTPILTLQSFLPLLQTQPNHNPSSVAHAIKPSVLVLTPSIISSLNPAFHLPESAITSAQSAFTQVLTSELAPLSIPVTHLQLGHFDVSAFSPHNKQLVPTTSSSRSETMKWDESTRASYARNYVQTAALGKGKNGSQLRELNNAVFDAMVSGKGGEIRIGMGSRMYGFVGKWVPRGLVGWMMGMRRNGEFGVASGNGIFERGEEKKGIDESEYVSVYNSDE